MDKKYYPEINLARGIGMLFVMLGHSFLGGTIGGFNGNRWYQLIFDMCYSFHMGLFFFLSGFVSARGLESGQINLKKLASGKAKRLLVPYCFFSVLVLMIKLLIPAMAERPFSINDIWKIFLGISPHGGVWFLWVLFFITMIAAAISRWTKGNFRILFCFGFACYGAYYIFPTSSLLRFMIFYVLGFWANRNYTQVGKMLTGCPWLTIGLYGLLAVINWFFPQASYRTLYLLTGIIGVAASMNFVWGISKESRLFRLLDEIGTYSYDMYLMSYFVIIGVRVVFQSYFHFPYSILILLIFIPGTFISYGMSKWMVRKNKWMKRLMVGMWS